MLMSIGVYFVYGQARSRSNAVVGTLRITEKDWSWVVSNETNESLQSNQIEFICRITNVGAVNLTVSEPTFGPSAWLWYREAGKKDYSSGLPPGTFRAAPIVSLGTNECRSDKMTLSFSPGDYDFYLKYLVDRKQSKWISSPVAHFHCD
jgi:hypothetical protein